MCQYNKRYSLTSSYKLTLDRLACRKNQSINSLWFHFATPGAGDNLNLKPLM